VLKPGGLAHIRVPDVAEVMRVVSERRLDIDDVLYQSPAGPITAHDVLYGYGREIERSGNDFFAHKTGFTPRKLSRAIHAAGFAKMYSVVGNLEINVLAFAGQPDAAIRSLFKLPADP
jgi:hypothetical protein